MDNLIEKLKEFKKMQEDNIQENDVVMDVSYYGTINLSKNDADLSNERKETLYLVEKKINGKLEREFRTSHGIVATIDETGEIKIAPLYKNVINEKELLLQLNSVIPLSLEKMGKIEKKTNKTIQKKEKTKNEIKQEKDEPKKYIENSKDAKIDLNKKITETKTFCDLVPEAKEKGIIDVRVRRKDNQTFEFIGINSKGEEVPLKSLEQTEGTNPTKEIIKVNQDGSKVKKEQVMTMLKIKNGQNQTKQNEGFTISLGNYGTPEISYYRRAPETNEYTSIPVNLENTNQKRTELEVREYMEKKRNTNVEDNIIRAEDRIEYNEEKETNLENIDDDLNNDNIVDESEIQIRKAAKRCKISVEEFKQELEKQERKLTRRKNRKY